MSSKATLSALVLAINVPQAATTDGNLPEFTQSALAGNIISQFTKWLADQATGIVPSKEDALAWLEEAIDELFNGLPRIFNLIKPRVKAIALKIAGDLYDSLFSDTGSAGTVSA